MAEMDGWDWMGCCQSTTILANQMRRIKKAQIYLQSQFETVVQLNPTLCPKKAPYLQSIVLFWSLAILFLCLNSEIKFYAHLRVLDIYHNAL